MSKIEYRVRPVTRYIVTRWEGSEDPKSAGNNSRVVSGEYDTEQTAYDVGYALCRAEHERLGYPPSDHRIQYPRLPGLTAAADGSSALTLEEAARAA